MWVNLQNGIFQQVLNKGIPVSKFPGGWGIGKKRITFFFFFCPCEDIRAWALPRGYGTRDEKEKAMGGPTNSSRLYKIICPFRDFSSGFSYGASTHSDSQSHGTLKNDCFVASFRAWRRQGCVGNETTKPSCLGEGVEGVSASIQGGGDGRAPTRVVSRENTFWMLSLAKADHQKGPAPFNPCGDFPAF